MTRKFLAAAALLMLGAQGATAQTVDWRNGTAVVTSASQACRQNGVSVGDTYDARYRHPNLGTNGNAARLGLFGRRTAHNFGMEVDFNNTFQVASNAVFVGGGFVTHPTYQPSIRMRRRLPNSIDETTPYIYMLFSIQGFFVAPGVTDCNINLDVVVQK